MKWFTKLPPISALFEIQPPTLVFRKLAALALLLMMVEE
jgi:hypothetical protein